MIARQLDAVIIPLSPVVDMTWLPALAAHVYLKDLRAAYQDVAQAHREKEWCGSLGYRTHASPGVNQEMYTAFLQSWKLAKADQRKAQWGRGVGKWEQAYRVQVVDTAHGDRVAWVGRDEIAEAE